MTIEQSILRLTHAQDWVAYNQAKTKEKLIAEQMIDEITSCIEPKVKRKGRKGFSTREKVFCMFTYVYNGHSSRRTFSDLHIAKQRTIISKVPHFNTILSFFNDPVMKEFLADLITIIALPLRQVELSFSQDATGFSTSKFERWLDVRTKTEKKKRHYKKLHAFVANKSNIITRLMITNGTEHDSPYLKPLVEQSSRYFILEEVSADKAYLSNDNLNLISKVGGLPLIPFKSNSVRRHGSRIWKLMYDFFGNNRFKFLELYHQRSNSETTFSMIKRNFGQSLRTLRDESQVNEILMKCVCHNLSCLIQESFELGLEIDLENCAETFYAQK